MPGQKKLGIHWGDKGLSLVEYQKGEPMLVSTLSFAELHSSDPNKLKSVSEDARIVEMIQGSFRNDGFSSVDVYLSLPSRDIILRWFSIPWMKPHEIQGVVSFEARKYIPFSLEEITFSYYPSTFTEEGVKSIGILFVGIKKDVLKRYINILSLAGLNVLYCEPSCMSSMRALVVAKVVDVDQTVAILNLGQEQGEIHIASNGYVKFIRDFSFMGAQVPGLSEQGDVFKTKTYNEARLSLDFFNRQHPEEVSRIITLTDVSVDKTICIGLTDELGIPVLPVDAASVLEINGPVDPGAVCALGVTMNGLPTVIDFDLSEGGAELGVQVRRKKNTVETKFPIPKVFLPFLAGFISLFLCGAIFLTSLGRLDAVEQQIEEISARLGEFVQIPVSNINANEAELREFRKAVDSLSLRTSYSQVLLRLTQLMPKGMWLRSFSLDVQVKKDTSQRRRKGKKAKEENKSKDESDPVKVQFSGSFYLNDTNAEFDGVNQLLTKLRSDEFLSELFKNFRLTNLTSEPIDKNNNYVTSFSVECE